MSTTLWFIILMICSYLLGSIPMSYLVAKRVQGIDLRKYGSGNVGSSNLHYIVSKKLSVPVALYDLCKGALMVFIAGKVGCNLTQQIIVGIAAIIGHSWPVFLRFSGGRGLITAMGVAFFIFQPWGIVIFVAIAIHYLWMKSTALPAIIAMAVLPLGSWLIPWPSHQPVQVTLGLIAIFIILIIRRLTAPRMQLSSPITTRELLLNRLLFDRDIKDGKAWIYRKPAAASPDNKVGK